jgi:hypothetical protein
MNNTKKPNSILLKSYALVIIILLSAVLLALIKDISLENLTRDTAAIGNLPFYTGWISYIGAMFWCAAASIALFTAYNIKNKKFFLQIGILSLILLIDDLFMIHDGLISRIGIDEKILFVVYGIIVLYIIINNFSYLKKNNYYLLLVPLMLFAISIFVDVLPESVIPQKYLFEDGSKFLGIGGWMIGIIYLCKLELNKRF